MPDTILFESAINNSRWEGDGCVLSVFERHASIVEGYFQSPQALDQFSQSKFGQIVETGTFAICGDAQILRFSPFSIYVVSRNTETDDQYSDQVNNLTDLSHGKCLLTFDGDQVLTFFRDYCLVDLMGENVPKQALIKTLFSDYEIVLWSFSEDHLDLLIDRSFAESFVDFVRMLFMGQTQDR